MTDSPTRPEFVYKYRTFDKKHLRMLSHDEIYFASRSQFNDPLDCAIPFTIYDAPTPKKLREYGLLLYEEYKNDHKALGKTKTEIVSALVARRPHTRKEQLEYEIGVTQEHAEKFGIFCTASDNSEAGVAGYQNNLMWAHYAESHTGFCVCLNVERLLAPLISAGKEPFFDPVSYPKEYPIFSPYKKDGSVARMTDQEARQSLTIKSSDWSYECEYRWLRQIKHGKTGRGVERIPPDVIDSVYLGLSVSDANLQEVKQILSGRGKRVKLYRAFRKDKSFGLDFIEEHY
jgi:hypothetical protein